MYCEYRKDETKMALLIGEEISFENKTGIKMSDDQLDNEYNESNIRLIIDQGRYPVDQLVNMFMENGRLKDDPVYQRGSVWGVDRKSKLIESLIMNVPIPPIYLFEKDYNQYEILDGKQRIKSIVEFYSNEYELSGLDIWTGLNGKRFDDLTPTLKNALNRRYISSIVILKETKYDKGNDTLIRTIFERLNSGGVALTTQESRNALLAGPFNDECKRIASTELFKEFWGLNKKTAYIPLFGSYKIVDDPETILINYSEYPLRFFAYRQIHKMNTSLVSFLDEYLKNANRFPTNLIKQLGELYLNSLMFMKELISDNSQVKKANKNLYIHDPLLQALSEFIDKKQQLLTVKEEFCRRFLCAIKNRKLFNGKYSSKNYVLERILIFKEIIDGCLKDVYGNI